MCVVSVLFMVGLVSFITTAISRKPLLNYFYVQFVCSHSLCSVLMSRYSVDLESMEGNSKEINKTLKPEKWLVNNEIEKG